jgi:hypothetical protein
MRSRVGFLAFLLFCFVSFASAQSPSSPLPPPPEPWPDDWELPPGLDPLSVVPRCLYSYDEDCAGAPLLSFDLNRGFINNSVPGCNYVAHPDDVVEIPHYCLVMSDPERALQCSPGVKTWSLAEIG